MRQNALEPYTAYLATVRLVIFLIIIGIKLINQLPSNSRWTCWTVVRTFRLWRPQSHHIYDLYESCGGRGSYSFSASWSVGSASGRKSSLLVQCGVTRNLWFKVSLITVFPHIVSSLEYFPPLNNFRSKNLRIINSFLLWIVSSLEWFPQQKTFLRLVGCFKVLKILQ